MINKLKFEIMVQELATKKGCLIVQPSNNFESGITIITSEVIDTKTVTMWKRKREPEERFLKNNPGFKATGNVNSLGNAEYSCVENIYKTFKAYNTNQAIAILKNL